MIRAVTAGNNARKPRPGNDTGSASLEFLGVLPILLLIALAGIQLGTAAYTATQAGTAARAAARAESMHDSDVTAEEAAANSVSDWLLPETATGIGAESVTVTVTIKIPSIVPGLDGNQISRSATMPREDQEPAE